MKRSLLAFLAILQFATLAWSAEPAKSPEAVDQLPPQSAPAEPAGAVQLFNGTDLNGWDGDPRLWSAKEGVLRGETTDANRASGNTFLILKDKTLSDFDLRLSFRMNAANNSGIQYRSKHIAEGVSNKWVVRGYQHELRNEIRFPNVSGFIYEEGGKRGRACLAGEQARWDPADPAAKADPKKANGEKKVIARLITGDEFAKLFKLGDWNDVGIIAKGNNIKHYLNGQLILDFTDNHPDLAAKSGILALQLHAGKPMWVEFKNIRIKEQN